MTDEMDKALKEHIDEQRVLVDKSGHGNHATQGDTKIAKVVDAIKSTPPKSTPLILAMRDALLDQHEDLLVRLNERKNKARKLLAEIETIQDDLTRIECAVKALKT